MFEAINDMKAHANKNSPEDFDFIVTTGDNIKPKNKSAPTDEELGKLRGLFDKKYIKDLPIYGVRGNHGARFADQNLWTNLSKRWDQWKMPNLYYTTEFVIDEEQGSKMAMLHIDSNFLLCNAFTNASDPEVKLLDHRTKKIMDQHCFAKNSTYNKTGEDMFEWIKATARSQAKDTRIIWRAAVLHHPMFALYYDDYVKLVETLLPVLRTYGYDFYFAGMEH